MGIRDWREVGELTVGSERYSHRCRRFLRKESGAPTIEGTAEPGFEYRKEAGFIEWKIPIMPLCFWMPFG